MSDFNGMNGTIMLNTSSAGLTVGTVPGAAYGYKRDLRVTVHVRIERLERAETYDTVTHEQVRLPLELSVTTHVWRPDDQDIVAGGATREPLREVAAHGTPSRFWTVESLLRMAELGDWWHLNSMRAGCVHQEAVYEDGPHGRRVDLDATRRCPVTGYRYGSAWLIEPLPGPVVGDLVRLLSGPIGNHLVYMHPDAPVTLS